MIQVCRYSLVFLMLALPNLVFANVRDWAQQAESAFALGVKAKDSPDLAVQHFREAERWYRRMYDSGVRSPALFRQWAKATFLADRLPQAILTWRLGLHQYPDDADMWANLQYARRMVPYPTNQTVHPPDPDWPLAIPRPKAWHLLIGGSIFLTGICLALSRWWWVRTWRPLFLAGLAMLGLMMLIGGWVLVQAHFREYRRLPIVVITADQVPFQRGNGDSYPPNNAVPVLSRGMEAKCLFEREGWVQIELAGGQVGWVSRSAVIREDHSG